MKPKNKYLKPENRFTLPPKRKTEEEEEKHEKPGVNEHLKPENRFTKRKTEVEEKPGAKMNGSGETTRNSLQMHHAEMVRQYLHENGPSSLFLSAHEVQRDLVIPMDDDDDDDFSSF